MGIAMIYMTCSQAYKRSPVALSSPPLIAAGIISAANVTEIGGIKISLLLLVTKNNGKETERKMLFNYILNMSPPIALPVTLIHDPLPMYHTWPRVTYPCPISTALPG